MTYQVSVTLTVEAPDEEAAAAAAWAVVEYATENDEVLAATVDRVDR